MAKFLNTRKAVAEIESLIREAKERLILVSPYLRLSKDFKELLTYRNSQDKITTVVFGKQDLKPDEMRFLEGLRFVILKFHEDLHAKCYLNDKKMIITSLNLYEFSMANNKEMGVLIDLDDENDKELYEEAYDEIKFIETTSDRFEFRTQQEPKPTQEKAKPTKESSTTSSSAPSGKLRSTSALAKHIGVPSKNLFEHLETKALITKDGKSWILTDAGTNIGGVMKSGQYGAYAAWPDDVVEKLDLKSLV